MKHCAPGDPFSICFPLLRKQISGISLMRNQNVGRSTSSRVSKPGGQKISISGCRVGLCTGAGLEKEMGRVMGRRALVAALILALAAGGACGYASSAQDRWTDTRGRSGGGQGRSSYRRNDNPLLDQAMDAFKQAKHLETSLKKSERAVSDQTKELKSELRKAKATARSTGQGSYFKREERLDKALMKDAEKETRRDKRLVRQAETEMRGDKKFLEQAYNIKDSDLRDDSGSSGTTCPEQRCHMAKANGLTPQECYVPFGSCPRISCFDYVESDTCDNGNKVCKRPSSQAWGCSQGTTKIKQRNWTAKKCPRYQCADSGLKGESPDFCTITSVDGTCPQLNCYHYTEVGDCKGGASLGHGDGQVCMRPLEVDKGCLSSGGATLRSSGGGGGARTGTGMRKSRFANVSLERKWWMMLMLVCLSLGAFFGFIMFRKHGVAWLLKGKGRPAPVPSYYGKL